MSKVLAIAAMLVLVLSGCTGGIPVLPATSRAPAQQATQPSGGTWTGTVSHEWTTHDVSTAGGGTETNDQHYAAHGQVASSQAVNVDRWKINSGQVTIDSSRSIVSDFTLGNCSNHFDDEASANETVPIVDGGIEIDGDNYNIRVEIPGITGSETSIRQTCPPQAPDTHDWAVADYTVLEGGTMTDPNVISGTDTDDSGAATTWELHRTP